MNTAAADIDFADPDAFVNGRAIIAGLCGAG